MYKKILIIMIFTFYVLGFFVLFNDKVSAEEISQFCEYTEPCITVEDLQEYINTYEVDTSIYDLYLLFAKNSSLSLYFFKSSDLENIFINNSSGNLYFNGSDFYFTNISGNSGPYGLEDLSFPIFIENGTYSNLYKDNTIDYAYYSNFDVLDEEGNVVLEKNNIEDVTNFSYYNEFNDTTYDYNWIKDYIYKEFSLNISSFKYLLLSVQEIAGSDPNIFVYFWNDDKLPKINSYDNNYTYLGFDDDTKIHLMRIILPYENFPYITAGYSGNEQLPENFGYGFQIPYDGSETGQTAYVRGFNSLTADDGKVFYYNNLKPEENDFQYVFDADIYGTKYSKVELVFDIKGNVEQDFDFNYDFHLIQPNGKVDELNVFNSPYFEEVSLLCSSGSCSLPKNRFFRILKDLSLSNSSEFDSEYLYDEFFDANEKSSNSNSYVVDNYHIDINKDILVKSTQSLKFVIDLTFDDALIIDSYFNSSIPFKVIYYERNSETSDVNYYETIDMTGKYGVMFLPKVDTSYEGINIRTLFKGEGHLDIQHRSSYDPENYKVLSSYSLNYCHDYLLTQNDIPYQCNKTSGSFEFYITNDNLYQSLFFVNSVYDNSLTANASVSYDTRYYTFYVFDTPDTVIEITNPNTGETTSISLKLFYNFVSYKENLGLSFNSFLKPINFIISSITEFYNDFCPPVVQKFFYISFVLLVVLFIIKLVW